MLFNSLEFLVFYPLVTALFFLVPGRLQLSVLFLSGCFFYAFNNPYYIVILIGMASIDFAAALGLQKTKHFWKKLVLIFSILCTVSVLIAIKYSAFLSSILGQLWKETTPILQPLVWKYALPLGLSIHTMQSLSYIIEVYKGRFSPEKNYFRYLSYIVFYPQLVAGPIERPQNLLPQLRSKKVFSWENLIQGLRLSVWGFSKKILIADNLGVIVTRVYDNPSAFSPREILIAVFFSSIWVYCDFSGYTDIARGVAKTMGFDLSINFLSPLWSTSVSEYWRKWHISLTSWFRDYVYIPLGGNRVGVWRQSFNLICVFVLCGLWHGASFLFVMWGLLHGLLIILEKMALAIIGHRPFFASRAFIPVKMFFTFSLLSMVHVLFPVKNFESALTIWKSLPWAFVSHSKNPYLFSSLTEYNQNFLPLCFAAFIILAVVENLDLKKIQNRLNHYSPYLIDLIYALAVVIIVLFGHFEQTSFVYFQF